MRAVVTTEARYLRTPDGGVWTTTAGGASFWERYLTAFDAVRVVARVLDVDETPPAAIRVNAEAVEVWPVPYYVGLVQYVRRFTAVRTAVRAAAQPGDAVILRVPSPLGSLLAQARHRRGLPYAVEVVGDPDAVFAPGVVDHPLRPIIRRRSVAALRELCAHASEVAFVTERTLQARYPVGADTITTTYSCIELDNDSFVDNPRSWSRKAAYRLVSVGSLEQRYKGVDVLIEAVARLGAAGQPVHLTHVGDGRYRTEIEAQVARLGLTDRVTLAGAVPAGRRVRQHLDRADLFVMPSRTEGLPRALIEAMARGLPAIGTTAGGIPELLDPEYLVPPDDPAALADAITAMLTDPDALAKASARNRDRAEHFASWRLGPVRTAWYTTIREAAAARSVPRAPSRVVHVIGSLDRGGAETVALDLCRAIPTARLRQTFVTLGGREGRLADDFRAAGAQVGECPLAPVSTFPLRLWRYLRALRPDVVVSHVSLASGPILLVAALAGVRRRVARVHSESDGRPASRGVRLRREILRGVVNVAATDVVAVTEAALRFAAPRGGDARHQVIHNGVNLDRLRAPDRVGARADLGLPADALLMVHIGRCAPEKNRGFLVRVHYAARRLRSDTHLLVVGPGGIEDLLDADPHLAADRSVTLLGERPDVGAVMAAADVLLLPSHWEGLPGVVLEALACGLPVLATDLAGLREVAQEVVGLHLLDLDLGPYRWAVSAIGLAATSSEERAAIRRGMRDSPFAFERSVREWERLCRPRG